MHARVLRRLLKSALPIGEAVKNNSGTVYLGADMLTPKDNTTTYYWCGVSLTYDHDDENASRAWESAIDLAFANLRAFPIEPARRTGQANSEVIACEEKILSPRE
jgi:hypothetical protein